MPKTIVHEFPLKPSADGKGFQIVDDFTRPNPLDHTRFNRKECEILVVSGWTSGNSIHTSINPTRVNAERITDNERVLKLIARHNEQVFQLLNAALAFLTEISLPIAHKVILKLEETTMGTPFPFYNLGPTPLCNCYDATLTVESDFGISGIKIYSYEFQNNGFGNVDSYATSDSKLSRQLEEAVKKTTEEKIPVAA